MDWQLPSDSVPSAFVTEALSQTLRGTPPVTGAWRDGDHLGNRRFAQTGPLETETGDTIPHVRIAYEIFGELHPDKSNAVLVFHALTGDSHATGPAGAGHPTGGWWSGIVGPGLALDTDQYAVIVPNIVGGCQGSTGPATVSPTGHEWGSRFPYLSIRDQIRPIRAVAEELGIERFYAVIGGSMGGMHALEWAIDYPQHTARLGLIATTAVTSADQLGVNSVQLEAIHVDPSFHGGDYYDEGEGPYRGLALARRMALLNYRSATELNERFERTWQGTRSPLGDSGRFAVESYLDFHGNKFTRRFDANSYLTLVHAMNSHDVGRERGSIEDVLAALTMPTLVVGVDSDRLFPLEQQQFLAAHISGLISAERQPAVISSPFGHDGFLIESESVGSEIRQLLSQQA
jgi:homoserine O-acetyltransferase/O-succinyltransferase